MNVRIEQGSLKIDIQDLLDNLSEEHRLQFIEYLACQDAVIKHVMDQILDGWTENACCGPLLCTASPEPRFGLDWAKREVARRAGEVAAEEIRRLEKALAQSEKDLRDVYDKLRPRGYDSEL